MENNESVIIREDFTNKMALQIVKKSKKLLRIDEKEDLAYVTNFCKKLMDFCETPSNQERYEKNIGRSLDVRHCEYEEVGIVVWVKHNNFEQEYTLEDFFDEHVEYETPT